MLVGVMSLPGYVTVNLLHGRIAYDGHTSVFVADSYNKAVHVLFVNGRYDCQLVSPQQLSLGFWGLSVDTHRYVLYVGHDKGTVGVFGLTYEPL
jgi:hypothetical protein